MTRYRFRKLLESKQREADKHNKLIEWGIKGVEVNGYDLIKEEYMKGRHGTLTENQIEIICDRCLRKGRGGVA